MTVGAVEVVGLLAGTGVMIANHNSPGYRLSWLLIREFVVARPGADRASGQRSR
ncbi:hypothetical protein [Amycolatopsis sp. NPDC049868]|uniref:hypothetical protein n=1 Tax=Amycolatopsis sp. NPDC049868 TaxID=3363934 RepID=UPI00379DE8A2